MFEIIFLIALTIYFIQSLIFIIGAGFKFKKTSDNKLPSATVIVAARNEEHNILECMISLDKLIYPEGKLEIILVNDRSTDKTGEIMNDFVKDKPKFKVIIPEKEIGSLKGKTNALANALKVATGEIILTTDADCEVSPTWAKTLASYYKEDVGIVCGYTNQEDSTPFKGMQSIDFIYLLTVAAGTMNIKKPTSCIGNNMSFRKSAYFEVGGYESLPFSVTEDLNLLMAIFNLKKYEVIYPLDDGGLVTSKACPDIKTLFWQKKRWGVGGLKSDLYGFSIMFTGFFIHLCMLLLPFFLSLNGLYIFITKLFLDLFMLINVFKKLKMKFNLLHYLTFEIYFIIYVIILPFAVLPNTKVKWKGREF